MPSRQFPCGRAVRVCVENVRDRWRWGCREKNEKGFSPFILLHSREVGEGMVSLGSWTRGKGKEEERKMWVRRKWGKRGERDTKGKGQMGVFLWAAIGRMRYERRRRRRSMRRRSGIVAWVRRGKVDGDVMC